MEWIDADEEPKENELLLFGDPENKSLQVGYYYKDTIGFCSLSDSETTGEITKYSYLESIFTPTDVKIIKQNALADDLVVCQSCDGQFIGIYNYCPHCGKMIRNIKF